METGNCNPPEKWAPGGSFPPMRERADVVPGVSLTAQWECVFKLQSIISQSSACRGAARRDIHPEMVIMKKRSPLQRFEEKSLFTVNFKLSVGSLPPESVYCIVWVSRLAGFSLASSAKRLRVLPLPARTRTHTPLPPNQTDIL